MSSVECDIAPEKATAPPKLTESIVDPVHLLARSTKTNARSYSEESALLHCMFLSSSYNLLTSSKLILSIVPRAVLI